VPWGLGWEVWLDGMEITQFTYFQQVGGIDLHPICVEITYGIERIAMYLQEIDNVYDLEWGHGIKYGDVHHKSEVEFSTYQFEEADIDMLRKLFDMYEAESIKTAEKSLVLPTYDYCLKCSHAFNILDARGAISVNERTSYIGRVRNLARLSAEGYVKQREEMGYPLTGSSTGVNAGVIFLMAKELLLEIGTEEIPAAFIPKALKDMERIITKEFSENRIGHGRIKTMGTPRRLLLSVKDVDERQEDQLLEKVGPSTKVAFDEGGKPTKAAIGFARGQGIDVSELEIIETPKGKQICSRKKITGEDTTTILTDLLPRFIMSIPFRKSMRWMDLDIRFARPVHWILALFGDEIIPFSIENITSGNTSRGHRFMAPEPFEVNCLENYLEKIKERFVVVDPGERKNIILDESEKAAKDVSGFVFKNEELLDEVSFLVEYPSVVRGSFDREYLKLPKEVLTTTMMKHQKYFPRCRRAWRPAPIFHHCQQYAGQRSFGGGTRQ